MRNLRDKNLTYQCAMCSAPTDTLHEIFYGTCNRRISIDFALQVPLCTYHHNIAHNLGPKGAQKYCQWLGLDYDAVKLAINKLEFDYLDMIKDQNIKRIIENEI
jgi:hypothetical protein